MADPTRPSVHTSPLSLVLGPVVAIVLVSIALSLVLVARHVRQIRTGLLDRGQTIAAFMSRDAVDGLTFLDQAALRHLTSLAVAQDDVLYAAIERADGGLAALRGEQPPDERDLHATQALEGARGTVAVSPAGWELRWPLVGDHGPIGQIRLGLSHATLDRERTMAVVTAVAFTTLVALLASAGAVVFMRRHLSTLVASKTLAEEHEHVADLKARIVTQASHEFRTPLTVIMSAADVLQRYGDRLTRDERTARVDKIRSAVHQMTDLLDDVLMFGRTDASHFTPTPTDLTQLCHQTVEQGRSMAPANVQLSTIVPGSPRMAMVDPFLLGQVLRGLLVNAIRYSPNGGTITLGLEIDAAGARIIVTDEGLGIPAEDLPRLFEPFQRGGNVGKIPGSGLGLAIAKRVVAVHGGTIEATSAITRGSTFTIRLPARCFAGADGSAAA